MDIVNFFVSYAEASEKPFTTNQIKSTIVAVDSGYKSFEFLEDIKQQISWKDDIIIISLSRLN